MVGEASDIKITAIPWRLKNNYNGYGTTNDATRKECYNEQFLSIKSVCYNELVLMIFYAFIMKSSIIFFTKERLIVYAFQIHTYSV